MVSGGGSELERKRKVHWDRGQPWWNHQVQVGFGCPPAEFTIDRSKVTCRTCLGLNNSPTPESLRGIRTKATPEENKRYHDRRAHILSVQRKCREDNWRIIDGVPEEEMERLREMMPSLRKIKGDSDSEGRR